MDTFKGLEGVLERFGRGAFFLTNGGDLQEKPWRRGVWSAPMVDTIMEVMGKAGNITSDNLKLSEVTVRTTLGNTSMYRCM